MITQTYTDPLSGDKIIFKSQGPPMRDCPLCGESFGLTNGFEAQRSGTLPGAVPGSGKTDRLGLICGPCFYAGCRDHRAVERERAKAEKAAPAPAPERDRRAAYSATRWPSEADAYARREVVAAHLGVLPEIIPVDRSGKPAHSYNPLATVAPEAIAPAVAYVVCPDSPLVPGFDKSKTKNPHL